MPRNRERHPAAGGGKVIHKSIVEKVRRGMPQPETVFDVADFFRVFGDSTRIGILYALSSAEMCGCDICALLNMTQSAVSHQLRILKQARLVRHRREGKIIYFRLDDEHINKILSLGIKHAAE
ncbi:MAG: metalloregulator ArsR/SmtB family transcription factor [Chitinivibrionales bacterium]|nr:metalloregulator ArsR/SmtB family transcription factor [Chitinivibrionales bacterium]